MTTQTFFATEEELELATQILVTRGFNGTSSSADSNDSDAGGGVGGFLQGDQGKEVFNRSSLPPATLRVIWNMSSENGNGVLSKHEIAKALRLIGWVQAGKMLSEKLLMVAGPLPTLDGITNKEFKSTSLPSRTGVRGPGPRPGGSGSPQIMAFPEVNEGQVRDFKTAFWQAGPVNGFLSEDKIMNAYIMTSNLSYDDIRDVINLIDRNNRRAVDLTEFACGLYLVNALQSSQLHSLPSTIPPDVFDQFTDGSSSASFSSKKQMSPPPYQRQASVLPSTVHRQSFSPQPPSRLSKPGVSILPPPDYHQQPPPPPPPPASSSSTTTAPNHQTSTDQNSTNNNDKLEEISQHDKIMFEIHFRKLDENNVGYLEREVFDEFVSVYRVPAADLDQIWGLTTLDRDFMDRDEFTIAMHLVKQRSEGSDIPTSLPISIIPPSLKSRRNTIAFTSPPPSSPSSSSSSSPTTLKLSIKKPPPPIPPKRRDSIAKPPLNKSVSLSASIPPNQRTNLNPFRQTISFGSLPKSPISSTPPEKSPFEDLMAQSQPPPVTVIGISRRQSPPPPLALPPPPMLSLPPTSPTSPPAVAVAAAAATAIAVAAANQEAEEALNKSKEENSKLSRQIEVFLSQLEAQNELRATNEGLRLENDMLKTQVKDMEKTMVDILESESSGSQERDTQDITRLMGELGEKEALCEEQERKIRALAEDEKELRGKMRECEGVMARYVADVAEYRQTIESQRQHISELNARVGDMTKVLADEPESSRQGTTSNRELRVVIRDVTKENDSLKSEVRNMHRSMEQLLLSTKHAKYDEMELENRKLKKSVGELENMVNQLQTSVGVSSNRRREETVARENEQLKAQLQDGKRQFADFRSTSETKIVDLQAKVEELTTENNRLKVDIHDASEGGREDGSVPPPAYDEAFNPSG